ncbi:MAG: hypothetical protein FWE23_04140 [Chitinivibrionia bacterium]|nr:hypothetical protein [Chitinivibrionia bacterium]
MGFFSELMTGQKNGKYIIRDKNGNTEKEEYYKNGELIKEEIFGKTKNGRDTLKKINYKNDKMHGEYLHCTVNGILHGHGHYEHGVKHGVWEETKGVGFRNDYWSDAVKDDMVWYNVYSKGTYLNDIKDGVWEERYTPNDKGDRFTARGNYINGKQEGEWEVGFPEKKHSLDWRIVCKITGNYRNGRREGYWGRFYYENGVLKKETMYGYYEDPYKDSCICYYEYYYKNNQLERQVEKQEYYYKKNQLCWVLYCKDGKHHGKFEMYHENGQLLSDGNNKDGQKHGEWKYYNESGLEKVENYKDGKKDGRFEEYDGNGQLKKVEYYQKDEKHGRFEWYNIGRLVEVQVFENGRQVSRECV